MFFLIKKLQPDYILHVWVVEYINRIEKPCIQPKQAFKANSKKQTSYVMIFIFFNDMPSCSSLAFHSSGGKVAVQMYSSPILVI